MKFTWLDEWKYKLFRIHPYTKYRPKHCGHPPFEGINYCWGLAKKVEEGKTMDCKGCDLDMRRSK